MTIFNFGYNNRFMNFMTKIANLLLLNFFFVVFSLPIFTIGASLTATYYVALKIAEDSETSISKAFFKSFISNFKQGTIVEIIIVLLGVFLFVDYRCSILIHGFFGRALTFVIVFISSLLLVTIMYVFPLMSKFYNPIKIIFKNAIILATANIKSTIMIVFVNFLPMLFIYSFPQFYVHIITIMVFIGFAVLAYINAFLFNEIFKKYIDPPKAENAESIENTETK